MSPVRMQLVEMLDYLPDTEIEILLEVARRFVPDDVATPDDLKAIQAAREEYAAGETVSGDAIDWN